MDYQQAWSYHNSLHFFKIKLGLASMERFLGRLGDPQRRSRFIHVAGTNGKGSVAAALQAVLAQAGYRVGLYTSPHLSCVRERWRINEDYISEADFAYHATAIKTVLNGELITYFEFATVLSLLWFAASEVDVAIMEVGMGGRLDATNVITPLVGVITNVSMDHQEYLGDTLTQVAAEKAGIIKSGVPLVAGVAVDDSRRVVRERCRALAAPLYLLGRDFSWQAAGSESGRAPDPGKPDKFSKNPPIDAPWTYRGLNGEITGLRSGLRGRHQRDNLSLALAALEVLADHLPVRIDDIRAGLAAVRWPGRLELLESALAGHPEKRRVLLDGAHNPAGVTSLVAALGAATGADFGYRRLITIWASMADKEVAVGLRAIAPLCDTMILTQLASERAASPAKMRQFLATGGNAEPTPAVLDASSPAMALDLAWCRSTLEDLIVVSGSLYLVGTVRRLLVGELTAQGRQANRR